VQLLDLLQAERIALINGAALVAAALVGRQSARLPRKRRQRCCRSRNHSHRH
jgi:hypothetical protein